MPQSEGSAEEDFGSLAVESVAGAQGQGGCFRYSFGLMPKQLLCKQSWEALCNPGVPPAFLVRTENLKLGSVIKPPW